MSTLNEQALRNTKGGSVIITALLIAYEAYRSKKESDWGGGTSGGGGTGVDW